MEALESLREYLRGLESGSREPIAPDPLLVRRAAESRVWGGATQSGEWWRRFACWIAWELQRAVDQTADAARIIALLGERDPRVEQAINEAMAHAHRSRGLLPVEIATYAFETRLTRRTQSATVVAEPGRILMRAPGRDALRWLLVLEANQSLGSQDQHRISREALRRLLRGLHVHEADYDQPDFELPCSWSVMYRLAAFGVLEIEESPDGIETHVAVLAPMRDIVTEIAQARPTAWQMLADAVLSDESFAVIAETASGLALARPDAAADAAIREVRLVAHEVRNALVPVRVAIDALYRHLPDQAPIAALRQRVDDGLARVFSFVDERLRVTELVQSDAGFDVREALRDAVSAAALDGVSLAKAPSWRARGPRHRLTLALVELLRNARQVRDKSAVWISSTPGEVIVEDDGPGVPAELRERVFERGFSLREGGTGLGLALVREIIERELRGTVTVQERNGGGARFVISLPVEVTR